MTKYMPSIYYHHQYPNLDTGDVLLFVVFPEKITASDILVEYDRLFSEEEKVCYNRFHFYRDRQRYRVSRALIKVILAHYSGQDPEQVTLVYNPYGKPRLANHNDLEFNISHCNGCIALALSCSNPVGVDVETTDMRHIAFLDIAASHYSTHERHQLATLPSERQFNRFIEMWTLKEAYIKAMGLGLSKAIAECDFDLDDEGIIRFVDAGMLQQTTDWKFALYEISHNLRLSLSIERRHSSPTVRAYEMVPLRTIRPFYLKVLRATPD